MFRVLWQLVSIRCVQGRRLVGKKTGKKVRKRLKFFDLGNTRCPICLTPFTRDAAEEGQTVTLEHIPPETLGGLGEVPNL